MGRGRRRREGGRKGVREGGDWPLSLSFSLSHSDVKQKVNNGAQRQRAGRRRGLEDGRLISGRKRRRKKHRTRVRKRERKRERGREGKKEGGPDRDGSTMLWNAVCVPAIFKTEGDGQRICRMKTSTHPLHHQHPDTHACARTHAHFHSSHRSVRTLLCLYYECYYYSCMSSCRLRFFSPSPEQESGHYWHPARLPNQSPPRAEEGGREGRKEGGMRSEKKGR